MENDFQHDDEAIQYLGEFVDSLVARLKEIFPYVLESINDFTTLPYVQKIFKFHLEVQAAWDSAPPKLKHYAKYSKRYRIRKKYLGRILKEYQEKKEG